MSKLVLMVTKGRSAMTDDLGSTISSWALLPFLIALLQLIYLNELMNVVDLLKVIAELLSLLHVVHIHIRHANL